MDKYTYSIIIPQRKSLDTLPRLFASIPNRSDIQIILVDNSDQRIEKGDFETNIDYQLLYSLPERFAGGARNVGIDKAKGEWLIFADADDYFPEKAFDIFDSYVSSEYDLIYFKSNSVYDDTLLPSDRANMFSQIIDDYKNGKISEITARISFAVPWAKMVRKCLVDEHKVRFDEVLAANDVMFSTLTGYYANNFCVDDRIVYTVTVREGSLSRRRDFDVIYSRYKVFLRKNEFLKNHGLSKEQTSVMYYIYKSFPYGMCKVWMMLCDAFRYRQNIFVGFRNWIRTFLLTSREDKRDKKYLKR